MSEPLEKLLISNFAAAWNETFPALAGQSSEMALLALREVSGDGMAGALAVANTWSAAFAATCSGALSGVLICLFKSDEGDALDRLSKQPADSAPKSGARALINATLEKTAARLASSAAAAFAPVQFVDLTADESRLAKIVGDAAWVGTFSLSVSGDIETQTLLLYAPHGSLSATNAQTQPTAAATPATQAATSAQAASAAPNVSRRQPAARREEVPRNIERLLDVELDVVVRFGMTNVPLRDVVRMGVGSMIELNRSVEEPVELLVNNRVLARGEVVVVDGYYGLRITEIGAPSERARSFM